MFNDGKKRINYGVSDFKTMIDEDLYYIDKTEILKEIIADAAMVKLITRPRRFGKTLNMSTMKYFFDISKKHENEPLFNGLNISNENNKDFFNKYQGAFPVIFITMKDLNARNYNEMISEMAFNIRVLYSDYSDIDRSKLSNELLTLFNDYASGNSVNLSSSVKILSKILYEYYGKKVIILIDEYDTPILNSYTEEFYNDAILFFRDFYSSTLKDNPYLQSAVLTGITRISKESIFSGLNNIAVYSIIDDEYNAYFGFSENEVIEFLAYYNLSSYLQGVKSFYDGYRFGRNNIAELYNPISVLSFGRSKHLECFWAQTGSEKLILNIAKENVKQFLQEIDNLLSGGSVENKLDQYTNFTSIDVFENIWSLLFFSGYLTVSKKISDNLYELKIPNQELYKYYPIIVEKLYTLPNKPNHNLLDLLFDDFTKFESEFNLRCTQVISYHDNMKYEFTYHSVMLGAFIGFSSDLYKVRSNREAGTGRTDITVTKRGRNGNPDTTYIFELKIATEQKEIENKIKEAKSQIISQRYEEEFYNNQIKSFAVVGFGKRFYFSELT